jgi:hypothetical protein
VSLCQDVYCTTIERAQHFQQVTLTLSQYVFQMLQGEALESYPDVVCSYFELLQELITRAPDLLVSTATMQAGTVGIIIQLALASLKFEGCQTMCVMSLCCDLSHALTRCCQCVLCATLDPVQNVSRYEQF